MKGSKTSSAPSAKDWFALLQNIHAVASGVAPPAAERAYSWLVQQPGFIRALTKFRRIVRLAKVKPDELPPFDADAEQRLLLHVAWLMIEIHTGVRARLDRTLHQTTAKRRLTAIKRLARLQTDFAEGIRLADHDAQVSLERGVKDLLQQLAEARRRYSGPRVQYKTALTAFANEMHGEFSWCGPEFLADIASIIGMERDRRTFARISKATRRAWSYLKP